jgi:uncharacterized protein YdhG (YjbR/CyaY superfamily)
MASANPRACVLFATRVRLENLPQAYEEALRGCGFRRSAERIEYRNRIQDLRLVPEQKLRWKNGCDASIKKNFMLYERCNLQGPAASRSDRLDKFLRVADRSGLASNPDMLQIGYLEGQAAAMLLLWVNEAYDGWSTMLCVGIVPEHTGKGLGRIVNSHGIRVLEANGGVVYHDGTEPSNSSMSSVFRAQGCREFCGIAECGCRRPRLRFKSGQWDELVGGSMRRNRGYVSVDDDIRSFPEDIQKKLAELRNAIREATPNAQEKISYQMPTFYLNGSLVHFAAHKNYIGFYPTPSGISEFERELSKYSKSKGSVQFLLGEPLPIKLVQRIVKFRVTESMGRARKSK